MKILYTDVETTGLNPDIHVIHQISGAIEIDGEVKEKFNFHVMPPKGAMIDKSALEVSGLTIDDLRNEEIYKPSKEVYRKISVILKKYVDKFDKTDKFWFAAYNAHFDNNFWRAFFEQNKDKYFGSWFWPGSLDVFVFANGYFGPVRNQLETMKLTNVCKLLGIELADAHDALSDIMATREVAKIVAPHVFIHDCIPKDFSNVDFKNQIPKESYKDQEKKNYEWF